jgi:hypothetical protein
MTDYTYAGHTLAEIKVAAEVATPGIWVAEQNTINGVECHCVGVADATTCVASTGEIGDAKYGHQSTLDADYIATANPATMRALVARIEALERDAARYRWMVKNVVSGSIGFGDWWINADEPESEWDSAIDAAIAATEQTKNREGA